MRGGRPASQTIHRGLGPPVPVSGVPRSNTHAEGSRFLRYLAVGLLNTAFSYSVYAVCIALGLAYFVANLVSLVCGICVGFQAHKRLVFKQSGRFSFLYFVVVWAVLYFFNITFIGWLLARGLNAYVAGALAIPPTTVLSYVMQRLLVFRGAPAVHPSAKPPSSTP